MSHSPSETSKVGEMNNKQLERKNTNAPLETSTHKQGKSAPYILFITKHVPVTKH